MQSVVLSRLCGQLTHTHSATTNLVLVNYCVPYEIHNQHCVANSNLPRVPLQISLLLIIMYHMKSIALSRLCGKLKLAYSPITNLAVVNYCVPYVIHCLIKIVWQT